MINIKKSILLICFGFSSLLANEKKLWLDLINIFDNDEKERLLAEGIARGLGLPDEWKELWKNETLRTWILQTLPYEKLSELPPLAEWSVVLRTQCWHRGILESWGGDDLLQKAQSFYKESKGEEQKLLQEFLKRTPEEWKIVPSPSDSSLLLSHKWAYCQSLGDSEIQKFKLNLEKLSDRLKIVIPEALSDETIFKLVQSKDSTISCSAYGEKWRRHLDWEELLKTLKEKSWTIVDAVTQVLHYHHPKPEVDMFSKAWSEQSDAGRFALSMWVSEVEHQQLSDFLCSAILKKQGTELCLIMLQSIGSHGKSDWLLDKVISNEIDIKNREKALGVLLAWDEVKKDRRYVKLFVDEGYRNGGPGGSDLLILMGKSQHGDAEKIIASHFKESETNPYSIDNVVEAAAYHGSAKLRQQIKSIKETLSNEFYTWAIDRSEGKVLTNWIPIKSDSVNVTKSFSSLKYP